MTLRFVDTVDDLPDRGDVLSRSGLEFMQDVLAGRLATAPIWRTLGFWLEEVQDGRIVLHGQPEFGASNPMRAVHGGWYGAILDSCMACAVMTCVPKGSFYTTLEYKINITRPIPLGSKVQAIGTVQHAGRSTGVAFGEVRGIDDDRLYATGSTTCIIMQGPS
jgi:uncharacterized protein (TIGR00369 family)